MTTVPGHNQILQQSTIVQELSNQAHSPKPSPDQAAAQQQVQETVKGSTVQTSEESERLKEEKAKQKEKREQQKEDKKKKKINHEEMALDPEATGRLLDTIV
ncbi:MAG: hypothetical protein GY860_02610 [Desulfobacteraceae bacterium]|nr:hypothetical protein [Desulfobacteraceae bacterium]